jgi:membrane protease YdiL (CAAX protease family)
VDARPPDLDPLLPGAPPPPPPAPPPPSKSAGAFFALVLVLYTVLGTAAQAANPLLGLTWSQLSALLLPALVAGAGSNLRPRTVLLLARRPSAAQARLGLAVGVGGFFVAGGLMALTSALLPARWVELFDLTKLFDRPPLERAALSLVASTIAPFCEEVAFRGYLLTAARTRHSAPVAVGMSALLFALMHLDPVRFPALLVLGSIFGWLAWRAGSIWPAILAHATNNTIGAVLVAVGAGRAAATPERPGALETVALGLATVGLAGAVLAALLAAYRRATPAPPSLDELLERRDPADPSTSFRLARVPPGLRAAAVVGLGALVALGMVFARRH